MCICSEKSEHKHIAQISMLRYATNFGSYMVHLQMQIQEVR